LQLDQTMEQKTILNPLKSDIAACRICEPHLANGCRPVVSFSPQSKVVIIGQAPGRRVHESGIPWDDKSGENLRAWLDVSAEEFYNPDLFAIVPMGFCYPGTGKSGDLPPRKECAPQWHQLVLESLKEVQLTLLIGQYAQAYYLGKLAKKNLTENVRAFETFLPTYFPLPHPSPRNNIWKRKNPWFEQDLLPVLARKIELLKTNTR